MCDEIVNAADSVTTNGLTNVRSSVPSSLCKKMDCYILHLIF